MVSPDDPLAKEHAAVAAFVEDAVRALGEQHFYQELDLKSVPSGALLLAGEPEQAKRYILAAVTQATHWDWLAAEVRNSGKTEIERINAHHLPGWAPLWGRRRQAQAVIAALMRRSLPFDEADLQALMKWCCDADTLGPFWYPIGSLVKAPSAMWRRTPSSPVFVKR